MKYEPRPVFVERIRNLLENESDVNKFFKVAETRARKSIRVNTLKTSPEKMKKLIMDRGWKINQIQGHPEIIQINSELLPGELGNTKEHILGDYYIQEVTSMMPIIALNPKSGDILLDLCASPGSKTTQAAALMENRGNIFANDVSIGRISILSSNLERIGVTNTIVTRHDGISLCDKFKKLGIKFDKILLDAPCSGEGGLRSNQRIYLEWSEKLLESLGRKQKKLIKSCLEILKDGGELVYSTCTYAPEENECVIQFALDNFNLRIEKLDLPLKTRPGILKWKDEKFYDEMIKAGRIYQHDNDMEGFFICKLKKLGEK